MALNSLESLHRRAKGLEASLEVKIQSLSILSHKINADFWADEESAMTRTDEDKVSKEIERLLIDLNECISSMKESEDSVPNLGSQHKDNLIKRYDEIYFDYKTEFQNASTALRRKRESMALFEGAGNNRDGDGEDSATALLLAERNTIANSMRSIGDVIGEATEAKVFLKNQRGLLDGGFSQLSGLNTRLPTFDQVIDGIQKKKFRDQAIIACIIGLCLIFIIWWTCLKE